MKQGHTLWSAGVLGLSKYEYGATKWSLPFPPECTEILCALCSPPRDLPRAVNREENKTVMQRTEFLFQGVNPTFTPCGQWPHLGYSEIPHPIAQHSAGNPGGGLIRMRPGEGRLLTHRGQVPAVFQHHVSVENSLCRVQEGPLLPGEIHGHVCEGHGVLEQHTHLAHCYELNCVLSQRSADVLTPRTCEWAKSWKQGV